MNTETKPLPKYSECEYSLFVSYAHRDDESENMWVSKLKHAIWMRLADLKRDIPKRQLHMSGDNGPSAGHLSDALKDRVKKSFGMLLVVGDGYVDSSWCEKELELFADIFGASGTTSRLYIVAMTQDALDKACTGPCWKQFVASDQLWVPMYQDTNPKKPIVAGNGEPYDERFFNQAAKIADRLIEEIEKDWTASKTVAISKLPDFSDTKVKAPLRIAFSPTTYPELDKYALALSNKLATAQATCFQIPKNLIDQYDPDDVTSLEELRTCLKQADALIVPFWEVTPLAPMVKGGHLGILDQEWRTLQKSRKAIWYKPPCAENLKSPADKHLDVIRNLSPLCVSEEAILSLVFGQQQGEEIRICIENHPTVKVYEPLIEKIEEIWKQLSIGESAPRIRCEPLDLDNLDDAPKDVSGVLLIYPVGLKPQESLKKQMAEVEKAIPKQGAAYPGRVALVFRPENQLQFPERSWPNVKCKQTSEKWFDDIDLRPDGELELQAFLGKLLRKFNKSRETANLL